jgi:hypothetical protein
MQLSKHQDLTPFSLRRRGQGDEVKKRRRRHGDEVNKEEGGMAMKRKKEKEAWR